MERKRNYLLLYDKVNIIDWEEHKRIRRLKEAVHILGYSDPLKKKKNKYRDKYDLGTINKKGMGVLVV